MQALKGIRRRIKSVQSVMKIASAMKMISIARLRKVQARAVAARVYHGGLRTLALQAVSKEGKITHPAFILRREIKKTIIFVVAPERGFCGPLDDNIVTPVKNYADMMKERGISASISVTGLKGARAFRKRDIEIEEHGFNFEENIGIEKIKTLSSHLLELYLSGKCDQVVVAYSSFLSAASHSTILDMFLPVWVKGKEMPEVDNHVDFIFEPSREYAIKEILAILLDAGLYRAFIEAYASELAARMIAMDGAIKNAEDMVESLSRQYNSARQTAITRDLLDIVSGAEALG